MLELRSVAISSWPPLFRVRCALEPLPANAVNIGALDPANRHFRCDRVDTSRGGRYSQQLPARRVHRDVRVDGRRVGGDEFLRRHALADDSTGGAPLMS